MPIYVVSYSYYVNVIEEIFLSSDALEKASRFREAM